MTCIGTFESKEWGTVSVYRRAYVDGSPAIQLTSGGEPLATLSVCMYTPECSHASSDLPPDCFYVKTWSENAGIAAEAYASGLFRAREDLPEAASGFVTAPVWEIVK